MTELFVAGLIMGLVVGFLLGRWNTEWRRARFDMRTAWGGRSRYRKP
ncbi:MAG: hypothetical protein ACRDZO_26485 [Egibacteraceae bacterium]